MIMRLVLYHLRTCQPITLSVAWLPCGRSHCTYVRQFAQAVGSVSEGYFLSWFVEKCLPGEWVSLNNDLLFNEAGITAKQWRNIRNSLLQKGILLNRRTVAPTESQFTLNDALFEDLVSKHGKSDVLDMVSPPISINKLT